MAKDVKFIVSANADQAIAELGKVGESGANAAGKVDSAFDAAQEKFKILPDMIRKIDFTGMGEKMKAGFEQASAKAGELFDYAKNKIITDITILGIALITGIAAGVLTAIWAIYESISFVIGLFTGESYKSKSIDAVIAVNEEVKALQQQLQLTAVDANALNDALSRLGVNKTDIITVYKNTETAIRNNKEELTRLGVAYEDANGKMLSTYDIVTNAKTQLDGYTAGWDRNQAAVALGLGSYEQMENYLKINRGELEKSKARLDEYNLGIGTDAQKAIGAYSTAMLEFNNELKLMGEGFKRAWADQIMPAFTTSATLLKNGWPVIVNIFRYSFAQLTSLAYGLKMVFDIIYETTVGKLSAIGSIITGIGRASAQVIRGDFSGAKQSLINGWEEAKSRIGIIGDNLVEKANKNMAAMKLAWGFDNRTAGNGFQPDKAGKPWAPKPDKPEEPAADVLKLWTDKAKSIINIEKERISTLVTLEKEYLAKLKTEYEGHVKTLETFAAAYGKIKDSIAARNKKDADANAAILRGAEDDYQKYYRALEESKSRESLIDTDISWTAESAAKKLEGYNAELELIGKIRDEAKANNVANISEYQVEADYQARKVVLETKISDLGDKEITKLTDIAVKAAEAVGLMERGIKAQEDQVRILDDMIKNIPNITEKTINLRINGIQDLYRVQELMTGRGSNAVINPLDSASSYSVINGRNVWGDGSDAGPVEGRASGGPVKPYATYRINEEGTEFLTMGSKGGYITPAGKTPAGSGGLTITGGISITLPNVTDRNTADDLLRQLIPKLEDYQNRKRA